MLHSHHTSTDEVEVDEVGVLRNINAAFGVSRNAAFTRASIVGVLRNAAFARTLIDEVGVLRNAAFASCMLLDVLLRNGSIDAFFEKMADLV